MNYFLAAPKQRFLTAFSMVLSAGTLFSAGIDPAPSPYDLFWKSSTIQEITLNQMLAEIRDSAPDSKRSRSEIRANQASLASQELRFDPTFNSGFGYREATWYNNYYDPQANNPYKYSEDYARGFNSTLGVSQPINTGGRVELQMFNNYTEDKWAYAKGTNGQYSRPLQEQMSSLTRINLVQPILKNAGWETNERPEKLQGIQLQLAEVRAKSNLIARQAEFLKNYYQYSHYFREASQWLWLQQQYQNIETSPENLLKVESGEKEIRNRLIYSQMKTMESRFLLCNSWGAPAGMEQSLFVPERISPSLTFSWQDSYHQFQESYHHRPELKEAKLWREMQALQVESVRNELKPNMDIYGNYGYRGIGSDIDDAVSTSVENPTPEWGAGFTFSIPLSERRDQQRLKMAEEGLQQAELNLLKVESQVYVNTNVTLSRLAFYHDQWSIADEALQKMTEVRQLSDLAPTKSLEEIGKVKPILEALNRESWTRYEYLRSKVEFEQNAGILLQEQPELTDLNFEENGAE